jgi:hypothetical protein
VESGETRVANMADGWAAKRARNGIVTGTSSSAVTAAFARSVVTFIFFPIKAPVFFCSQENAAMNQCSSIVL